MRIERALPEFVLPEDVTPVIYLPHVPLAALRAGDDCPEPVRALVELQYRGTVWYQRMDVTGRGGDARLGGYRA